MNRVLFSIAAIAGLMLFPIMSTAGQGVGCASLVVIDGDTIKCDGQNMRLLGGGGAVQVRRGCARDGEPCQMRL